MLEEAKSLRPQSGNRGTDVQAAFGNVPEKARHQKARRTRADE